MIDYKRLLSDAQEICAKRPQDKEFNIFTILRNATEEVLLHSRFLFEMLNTRGSHNFEYLYLSAFIDVVNRRREISIPEFSSHQLSNSYVFRERDHIDLLIFLPDGYTLIIENKIYAEDQERQLKRYYDEVITNYKRDANKLVILYLTLDGHSPSEISTRGLNHPIHCISYANEINEWLNICIGKTPSYANDVKEVLKQYRCLIVKLANVNERSEIMQQIAELILKNEDSLKSAIGIAKAINLAKSEIMLRFMIAIEKEFNKRGYNTILFDKNAIECYYISKEVPAIAFLIKKLDDDTSFCFIIEVYDCLYYYLGFCKHINSEQKIILKQAVENDFPDIYKKLVNAVDKVLEVKKQTTYSIVWDYILDSSYKKYNFKKFDDNCIVLIDEAEEHANRIIIDLLPLIQKMEHYLS